MQYYDCIDATAPGHGGKCGHPTRSPCRRTSAHADLAAGRPRSTVNRAAEHGTAYDAMFKLRLIADYTITEIGAGETARTEAIVAGMRRLLVSGI